MAPKRQIPGYAHRGQYTCLRRIPTPDDDSATCGKEVPQGELTHATLNSLKGPYLALCLGCRADLDREFASWAEASVGNARLVADLFKLNGGTMISKKELRRVLLEHNALEPGQVGPLSRKDEAEAVRLMTLSQSD